MDRLASVLRRKTDKNRQEQCHAPDGQTPLCLIESTPLGNRIMRIARKHGSKVHLSKNWYLKLYRGGKVTSLRLFEGKLRSADLADDIKNYLRRPGKGIEDAKKEFFDDVRAPSTAIYATLGEVMDCHAQRTQASLG